MYEYLGGEGGRSAICTEGHVVKADFITHDTTFNAILAMENSYISL
jgi:hypothetical protein